MTNKTLFGAFLALAFSAAVIASPRERVATVSAVHRDENRGFSIELPSARGWEVVPGLEGDIALALEGPDVSVVLAIQKTNHILELDFLGIFSRDSIREHEEGYREIEAKLMTEREPPFYTLEYECRHDGKTLHVLRRIYVKEQRVASVSVVGEAKAWARSRRVVMKMLDRFAFLKEASVALAIPPGPPHGVTLKALLLPSRFSAYLASL